jgi:hypothetical protein
LLLRSQIMQYIDVTPTWEYAVNCYVALLLNPHAGSKAHESAREDLLRLARAMDATKAEHDAAA